MKPQPTAVPAPIALRIADDIRMKIERGELKPDDPLPTLQDLCKQWDTSMASAREARTLLKQQGLITVGRGKTATVRAPLPRAVRSSTRHQEEKDLVHASEDERRATGLAETDLGTKLDDLTFNATYEVDNLGNALAKVFGLDSTAKVLRRIYELRDQAHGTRLAWSVSYLPYALIDSNPDLLDATREPWPGGTQHQLSTVGIELATVVDEVSAFMPTTADARLWNLQDGVPMLRVRRISIDTTGRVVEVSDADYPADRTELSFTTPLDPW